MEIITRDIINKDLVITSLKLDTTTDNVTSTVTTYNNLINRIDTVKEFLITKYNVTPGQKIAICIIYWPDYVAWFFACCELGISFVVIDYPRTKEALAKFTVYGDIDYVAYDVHYPSGLNYYSGITVINSNDVDNYNYSGNKTPIRVTSDSVLLYATTSGTTGSPKKIINEHKYFWDLMDRNARVLDLKYNDRCLHSKTLHHGSVSCAYFIPAMKHCSHHYHAPYNTFYGDVDETPLIKAWVNLIQEEKITKCLMFYEQIDDLIKYLDLKKKQHDNLTVFVLSKIKQFHLDVIIKNFNYKIISIFGSVETGGPLFLPQVTTDKIDSYDPFNMGSLLDDMFQLRINERSLLEIKTPWANDYVCIGDKFEINNKNEWIYGGRENIYKINGRTIYLLLLIQTVESSLKLKNEKDFDIIVDQKDDKIYIRSEQPIDLNQLNDSILNYINEKCYTICYNLVIPRNQCFSGIKFDQEYIRIVCRNAINQHQAV
jgi:acyl-coenzyme A synthetase/AMP-(fatty) acid ligase